MKKGTLFTIQNSIIVLNLFYMFLWLSPGWSSGHGISFGALSTLFLFLPSLLLFIVFLVLIIKLKEDKKPLWITLISLIPPFLIALNEGYLYNFIHDLFWKYS